jgi:AbrB family looped-hinge helix DNA binding protein
MAWGAPTRERRILKAGHSSIAVTLPKPWAEAMNLRPGDLVVFDQNDDGTLFLKPAPTPGAGSTASPFLVHAQSFDTPGVLERLVVGAYRVGHDAIEIRSDVAIPPERVEELLQAARGLLGVSVVAQEPNRILLQNFIDPSKYGLPQLVQRMKMILVAFIEESETMLGGGGRSRRLTSLKEETSRVLALLVRQLFLASRDWSLARRIGSPDPRHLLEWRVVVHALHEMGELLEDVASRVQAAPDLSVAAWSELSPLLTELKGNLKAVVDALMHPSLGEACDAFSASNHLAEAARSVTRGMNGAGRRSGLQAATSALERSAASLTSIAEVALDRAVSMGNETVLVRAG